MTLKARRLLERLEDFTDALPVLHVKPLLKVMFDLGDTLRISIGCICLISTLMSWHSDRLSVQSLERNLESEEIQYELLRGSVIEGAYLGEGSFRQTSLSRSQEPEPHSYQISDRDHWEIWCETMAVVKMTSDQGRRGQLWNLDIAGAYVLSQRL